MMCAITLHLLKLLYCLLSVASVPKTTAVSLV